MNLFSFILGVVSGLIVGWLLASLAKAKYFANKFREIENKAFGSDRTIEEIRRQLQEKDERNNKLSEMFSNEQSAKVRAETQLAEARSNIEEQKELIDEATKKLKDTFEALSSAALKSNNQAFLELAKSSLEKYVSDSKGDLEKRQDAIDKMIIPLKEELEKYDKNIKSLEASRKEAYGELKEQLANMKDMEGKLQKETNALVTALKTSQVRGKYGEIGLKRVVEFAGMSKFCDFEEQVSKTTEEGYVRPDLIVKLPGNRTVIIDAKVPLLAYMQAFETTEDTAREGFLKQHAKAVREHLKILSSKTYWSQFKETPDFVVLYMQIESSFGAALEVDRNLIEDGLTNQIIFATPTTLITLLRTVAYSWYQEKVTENSKKIWETGVELFNRITILIEYLTNVGEGLKSAVDSYNKAISSLETRFIPQVKKLKELGAANSSKELPEIQAIDIPIKSPPEINEE